ncbi:hypothetical protein B0J18DRAFT_272009 [Chaetomium sp. MPI-SDFR-AT-0129]|nr:hypothetical protein B0J18DRAFT_272009 [Chaetomium sp. MPI-SDFR-AT-0129]
MLKGLPDAPRIPSCSQEYKRNHVQHAALNSPTYQSSCPAPRCSGLASKLLVRNPSFTPAILQRRKRVITDAVQLALEKEAVVALERFLENPGFCKRRTDVERRMVIRTAQFRYKHCPKLSLGAAIAISGSYDITEFQGLQRILASDDTDSEEQRKLKEKRIADLTGRCFLDSNRWLAYAKHLQGEPELLVLASLGIRSRCFHCRHMLTLE